MYLFKEKLDSVTLVDGEESAPFQSIGTYGYPDNPLGINLADMTHMVQEIEWNEETKAVDVEINTFDHITQSRETNVVKRFDLLDIDEKLKAGTVRILPLGLGIVKDGVVSNYELQSTHLVPVKENSDE